MSSFIEPVEVLKKYKDSDIKVIGYTCSYVPEELIIAARLQPFRIPATTNAPSSLMPSFICPMARTILNNIISWNEYFDGIIISHTCDPMWRMYDVLKKKLENQYFYYVLHTILRTSILLNSSREKFSE